ncbi:MAG: purine-nucleoside phosphorylase [Planctomycetes bacterium]|nr:purine-nucleoside phosphorylase [Planctomycetota bacterium]
MKAEQQCLDQISNSLHVTLGDPPQVAVVLGSGWKERAADLLTDVTESALAAFEGWPQPKVQGHGGEIQVGTCDGRRVALVGGRVHSYEGYEAREIVRGVRALIAWGVPNILLLNAAGSLRSDFPPGTLMVLSDHINMGLPNPLASDQDPSGVANFLNLVGLYHPDWRQDLAQACPQLTSGVYAGLPGPNYETPAEVLMLQTLGADAVGMSTVPEALAAKAAGANVLGISLITNYAASLHGSQPSHEEVLQTATAAGETAAKALAAAISTAPRS